MGYLNLKCLTLNGTRLLGMSYTTRTGSDMTLDSNGYYTYTHTVLIQSNPSPESVNDVSWSLVSAWERNSSSGDNSMACHVDPSTGVFTMMSGFNVSTNGSSSSIPQGRSAGLQYSPRTDIWTDLTLSSDYRWGDVTDAFTVFRWPNSSTLYQANIAPSNDGTVNLGMLQKTNGSNAFVNSATWALDPTVYGYPTNLVFGNGSLYQFGAIVVNNKTGAFRSILTKLPLTSNGGATFTPPALLEVTDASSMSNCSSGHTYTKFYGDNIYVLCQETSNNPYEQGSLYSIQQLQDDGAGSILTIPGVSVSLPLPEHNSAPWRRSVYRDMGIYVIRSAWGVYA